MKNSVIILICILFLSACRGKKHDPGNDRTNNEFYAEYVRMYSTYNKVPLDSTKAALQRYLVKFPNNSSAWTFMAKVCLDLNQKQQAEAAYRTALTYNPKYGPAMTGLGTMFSWVGKNDSAIALLNNAVANGDSGTYNFLNIAIVNLRRNDKAAAAQALSYFKKVDSLDDNLLEHLVVISHEVNDSILQQTALKALAGHGSSDPNQDSPMARYNENKITAIEFFDAKRKQPYHGK